MLRLLITAALVLLTSTAYADELTANEYKGCNFLALAGNIELSPIQCVNIKRRGFADCYASSLVMYRLNSGLATNHLPASVRQVGMAACAMLTNNIPEQQAFDAAMKAVPADLK